MQENGKESKPLFNQMVKGGRRTYFISVREASNKQKYVTITESKVIGENKFDRFNIMVFQDKIGEFVGALQGACAIAA
ncbi:hypothetical protein A2625_03655 [candidate division WOR-1 bacterium RIFCSPHIGHO2_01_FULL_53_15]|uniref:DUF3276 family protein n=1 Tax=candidate division WOR-1 bacterium RIFCSPHIGHO2_01_FULL_53_15 TaxID=1802564 RepID=A0A1F4PZY2_UNCSA|nr:MAG: hypothetical protein A2625_03655 [candidate division WOR-1 bacterium RIFCSPHIGHO2_01_FULL_53_15]